jgi:hypothetical protein
MTYLMHVCDRFRALPLCIIDASVQTSLGVVNAGSHNVAAIGEGFG